jgi:phage baseplate assembly protein W
MTITEPLSPSIRGIAYPLEVVNGTLATRTDYGIVTQQIRSILETRYYERVMRADYGIGDYVLEILDPAQINSAIQSAIWQYVQGLSSLEVTGDWQSDGENGLYTVFINYEVDGVPQPPLNFTLAN